MTAAPSGWERLKDALDRQSSPDVRQWLSQTPERERRRTFPEVSAYPRAYFDQARRSRRVDWEPMALALLGCAPTAKQATAAVKRTQLWWGRSAVPVTNSIEVVRERNLSWLAEFATALTARLDDTGFGEWRLADALLREAGLPTPTGVGFVTGWLRTISLAADPYRELIDSPHRETLLPALFEHDAVAGVLVDIYVGAELPPLLGRLAGEDAAARSVLLAGCRDRLLRGGRPIDQRAFVLLHDLIAPSPAEIASAQADYLALLGSAQSTVAGLAQRALRTLDEAGLMSTATLVEVSDIVLARTEKVLVKAQAVWLRAAARRTPADRATLLALLNPPVEALPPVADLAFVPPDVPTMPGPARTVAELAEETAALLAGDWSVGTVERVLAGLVSLARTDRDAVVVALDPIISRQTDMFRHAKPLWAALTTMAGSPAARAAADPMLYELHAQMSFTEPLRRLGNRISFDLFRVLEHRMAEMGVHGMSKPAPLLLATPTMANGGLDPGVLLDRLTVFEDAGRQPWPTDLAQALLRLPREHDAAVAVRAARLASPAGIAFAARLRDGHPDPISSRHQQHHTPRPGRSWGAQPPARRTVVAMSAPPGCSAIEQRLFTLVPGASPHLTDGWSQRDQRVCAAVLPAHRDVVAAWALPELATQADADTGRGAVALLPLLAETGGPVGPAIALALTYGLATKNPTERIAAVDALLAFDATLDHASIGRDLGELGADGLLKVNRAAAALGEAARTGAVTAVWEICQAALPALLGGAKPRPGAVEMLEVANLCAQALGTRVTIPAVDQAAARGGSGRLVTEARRLRTTLTP
jgi:hypothetical protein